MFDYLVSEGWASRACSSDSTPAALTLSEYSSTGDLARNSIPSRSRFTSDSAPIRIRYAIESLSSHFLAARSHPSASRSLQRGW